jgi:uncharacterized membrane protein
LLDALTQLKVVRELIVIIIAALPIFELRGAIPIAINLFQFPWYYAFLLAFVGNLLPVPFILLFLERIVKILSRINFFHRFFSWLFTRTQRRSAQIQKYERIGLLIFVAIPLPFTGAWTGAIAAAFIGMPFWRSFISITIGVVIAGVIVTCLSLLGWIGAVIASVALCITAILGFWKLWK